MSDRLRGLRVEDIAGVARVVNARVDLSEVSLNGNVTGLSHRHLVDSLKSNAVRVTKRTVSNSRPPQKLWDPKRVIEA